jgi:AcrR family transcriptional regulator
VGIQERRQREFARREREILDAALRLFDSDDWLSVTVEEIAQAAEIGKGTIYKHFSSKEAIYARLALDFLEGLFRELEDLGEDSDVVALFRTLAVATLEYHVANPQYRRVVQYCKRGDFKNRAAPQLLRGFEDMDARFDEFGTRLIQHGIDQAAFANRPVEHLKYGLHAMFEGAVNSLWEGYCWGRDIDPQTFIEATVDFMLAGLTARPLAR